MMQIVDCPMVLVQTDFVEGTAVIKVEVAGVHLFELVLAAGQA